MFPSHAAALTAAEHRQGIAPAVAQVALDDPERKSLVPLAVRGTPVELLWHVTMLAPDRRSSATAAFHRFVGTPSATHAMQGRCGGCPRASSGRRSTSPSGTDGRSTPTAAAGARAG